MRQLKLLILLAMCVSGSVLGQDPKYIGMSCKKDVRNLNDRVQLGIYCEGKDFEPFAPKFLVSSKDNPELPSYSSKQRTIFFPMPEEKWWLIEMTVDDAVQTHYIRIWVRSVKGKAEFKRYEDLNE